MASQISGHLAPSSPVAGYYMWLDASNSGSITSSGGYVSQWNDLSGNGLHVSQAGANSTKPQTGINTMNGKNVLYWNDGGTLRGLFRTTPANLQGNPDVTIFVAAKYLSGGAGGYAAALGFGDDQASPNGVIAMAPLFIKSSGYIYNLGANGALIAINENFKDVSNVYVLKKSSTAVTAYVNKTSKGTASGNWAIDSYALAVGYLPQNGSVGNYSFNGNIAEILVYTSALSDVDRELNIDYLRNKWGI